MNWILRIAALIAMLPVGNSLLKHGYTFAGYMGIVMGLTAANILIGISYYPKREA